MKCRLMNNLVSEDRGRWRPRAGERIFSNY